MLAPVAEADHAEQELLGLGLRAAAGFAAFCAELAEASGRDPGHRATGTLVVARDRDDAEELERRLAVRDSASGSRPPACSRRAARRAEPALAPTVRLALDLPGDHSVDPRRLVAALAEAVGARGRHRPAHAPVRGLAVDGDRVRGVACATAPRSPRAPSRGGRRGERRGWRASRPAPPFPSGPSRGRCCGCATRAAPA